MTTTMPLRPNGHAVLPTPRPGTLGLLGLGHLAIAAVGVLLIALPAVPLPTEGAADGGIRLLYVIAIGVLVFAQVLAVVVLAVQRRALARGRPSEKALVRAGTWILSVAAMSFYPATQLPNVLTPWAAVPPWRMALLIAAVHGAQLLACGHAAWTYRWLRGRGGGVPLPVVREAVLRSRRISTLVMLACLAVFALAMVVATAAFGARRPPDVVGGLVQNIAALAVVAAALLLLPALLHALAAIGDRIARRDPLDRAVDEALRLGLPAAAAAAALSALAVAIGPEGAALVLALVRAGVLVVVVQMLLVLVGVSANLNAGKIGRRWAGPPNGRPV